MNRANLCRSDYVVWRNVESDTSDRDEEFWTPSTLGWYASKNQYPVCVRWLQFPNNLRAIQHRNIDLSLRAHLKTEKKRARLQLAYFRAAVADVVVVVVIIIRQTANGSTVRRLNRMAHKL